MVAIVAIIIYWCEDVSRLHFGVTYSFIVTWGALGAMLSSS